MPSPYALTQAVQPAEVAGLDVRADGQQIALGLSDGSVRLLDDRAQEIGVLLAHKQRVHAVAYLGGGVVSASADKTLIVWRGEDEELPQPQLWLRGHTLAVVDVAVSEDGAFLASASWDKSVRVWNAATGQEECVFLGHTDWIHAVVFLPGGRVVSAGSDHAVRIWSLESKSAECVLGGHVQSVMSLATGPGGILLASGSLDRSIRVWAPPQVRRTGGPTHLEVVARLQGDAAGDSVYSVRFAPDGSKVAAACQGRYVKVWSFRTGAAVMIAGHSDAVARVCFFPHGAQLASCSPDCTLRLWTVPEDARRRAPTDEGATLDQTVLPENPPPEARFEAAVRERAKPAVPDLDLDGGLAAARDYLDAHPQDSVVENPHPPPAELTGLWQGRPPPQVSFPAGRPPQHHHHHHSHSPDRRHGGDVRGSSAYPSTYHRSSQPTQGYSYGQSYTGGGPL